MKANELRIGNFVVDHKGRICRVTEIHGVESDSCNGFMAWPIDGGGITTTPHKPIPCSEQWLKDFGFEKNKKHFVCDNIWIELDFNSPAYPFYNIFIKQRNSDGVLEVVLLDIELRYVHQLQNLYFALTGEELTLKKDMDS